MTKATWGVSLDVECPKCDSLFDLMDDSGINDALGDRVFQVCEHGTDNTSGVEVECPECHQSFNVDFDY